ncbi:type IV pilus modification PilV family protein [Acidisoma sp. C75]
MPPPCPEPRRREAGFTLLEVLVAFVIAALAAIVLYRAAFDGAAESGTATLYQEATERAQSRLASIGTLTPLHPEQASGADGGGFRWRVVITERASEPRLSLYTVRVTEQFGSRSVTLTTERLAARGP